MALSLRQACRELGLSWRTLRGAIDANELKAARIGTRRITVLRVDLEDWLRSHAIRPELSDADWVERHRERAAASAGSSA